MPIRKKGNIKVKTSPNRYGIEQTGYTFYSYDKNSAALVFTFIDSDNAPVNLSKADVQLLLISDNGDEFPVDKDDIDVISAVRGTARYVIPENLLGYEGKITGHIYLDFEDGSHTDEGQFTFNIQRSMISDVLPKAGDKYVQDFEDVKERVEQAGDSATKDIEKAKDNAESQIGDYVGEVESAKDTAVEDIDKALPEVVESAKQDIDSSVSDVQSKASEDISNLIKSTEDARDEAVKSMNEIDYSNRNLLKGTSDEWETYEWDKSYGFQGVGYSLEELGLGVGDTITLSKAIDNTLDDNDLRIWAQINFKDINGETLSSMLTSSIESGQKGYVKGTKKIPEKTAELYIHKANKGDSQTAKIVEGKETKLQLGTLATSWTPAPEDIVLKSEMEKIKQAIINLGGSI